MIDERGLAAAPARSPAAGPGVDDRVEGVAAAALRTAVAVTGASRGVVLMSDGARTFAPVVAAPPDGALGATEAPESSPLWQVALGRTTLRWHACDGTPPPVAFAGREGWRRLLLAGLQPGEQGRVGVIVVADPCGGAFGEHAADHLELIAALSSTALANALLVGQWRQLTGLLSGAVALSAVLTAVADPAAVRRRLLDGLVRDVGMDGAALWCPGGPDEPLRLVGSSGLPPSVRQAVRALPADGPASGVWPGRTLRLVPVPRPAEGILGVYTSRRLPDGVDDVLAVLARALATAVRETTLHQRARTVVDSLQRQLLPRDVRLPTGVEVGTVYRSATAGVEVGGDFFDVFASDTGHVGVACGDVSGKGVEAASLTAMAVYSLRAYALPGPPASSVLRLLNGAVSEQTPDDRFVTLAYARIDPVTFQVQLALAGHPPPLVVAGDEVRVLDVPPDVPVGTLRDATFEQAELALAPGHSLVLYTDGVTEARRAGDDGDGPLLGVDGLVEVVRRLTDRGPQELADGVWAAVREWTGDGTTDDCAVIVVRRAPEPAPAAR